MQKQYTQLIYDTIAYDTVQYDDEYSICAWKL